jgi:hypothetical protein
VAYYTIPYIRYLAPSTLHPTNKHFALSLT